MAKSLESRVVRIENILIAVGIVAVIALTILLLSAPYLLRNT